MARAIGLDIGSRAVKLVELEGSAKRFKVTRYLVREYPGDGGAAEGRVVTDAVGEVLKEAKAAKSTVVVALDSGVIVIREILVPFLEEDQIRKVLRFEAEAHLHNFAIEDVVVDYVKVGEVRDQSKILVFAAPKDRIRDRLIHTSAAGIDPMHVTLDLVALFNAAKAAGAFEANPDCVLLDIGATTTNLLFVHGGRLKSLRSLRTGAESLTRVLAQDLQVDTDSAREMAGRGDGGGRDDDLLAPLDLPDEDEETVPETQKTATQLEHAIVRQRQDDFLTRLHRETTRSLSTFSGGGGLGAIYVTGGASRTGGLKERLEERFGAPVVPLDFLGDGDHAVPAADHDRANAQIGVALGSALAGIDHDGIDVEFRREELRYTRKFDLVKVTLASTVTLVFLLLFLVALWLTRKVKTNEDALKTSLQEMNSLWVAPTKQAYKDVLDDTAKRLPADTTSLHLALPTWMNQIRIMGRHITNEMGYDVQDIPPIRSALTVWNEFFGKLSAVRDQLGYLYLDDIEIRQSSVKIDGLIGNRALVDDIRRELEKIPYVESVEIGTIKRKAGTDKDQFSLTANLVETEAERKGP